MEAATRSVLSTHHFSMRLSEAKPPFEILLFVILRFAFPWFFVSLFAPGPGSGLDAGKHQPNRRTNAFFG